LTERNSEFKKREQLDPVEHKLISTIFLNVAKAISELESKGIQL